MQEKGERKERRWKGGEMFLHVTALCDNITVDNSVIQIAVYCRLTRLLR